MVLHRVFQKKGYETPESKLFHTLFFGTPCISGSTVRVPGLKAIKQDRLVQVPSANTSTCGQSPPEFARLVISFIVFWRELASSLDTRTGCVNFVNAETAQNIHIYRCRFDTFYQDYGMFDIVFLDQYKCLEAHNQCHNIVDFIF